MSEFTKKLLDFTMQCDGKYCQGSRCSENWYRTVIAWVLKENGND